MMYGRQESSDKDGKGKRRRDTGRMDVVLIGKWREILVLGKMFKDGVWK